MVEHPRTPPSAEATVHLAGHRLVGRLFFVLVAALFLFALLDYVFEFQRVVPQKSIRRLFNCAREGSIPSWFSSSLLVFTGLTLLATFFLSKKRGARRRTRVAWFLLAGFFVFMGIDDAAEIHERVGSWLGGIFRGDTSDQPAAIRWVLELPAYSWQIFLLPLFIAMGVFTLVFLWGHMGRHGLRRYVLLGLGCFAVAVGLDALERIDGFFENTAEAWGWRTWSVSHTSKVVEEILEMFGATCFWVGFLHYFVAEAQGLWFTFGGSTRAEQA